MKICALLSFEQHNSWDAERTKNHSFFYVGPCVARLFEKAKHREQSINKRENKKKKENKTKQQQKKAK
jgi:mannose/fructose/N-acetylgalactosamine-specific phosphotransferase system component IID